MPHLVLASASPRRRELLSQTGFVFDIHPAHIPEDPRADEDPIAYVTRLAREKAETVWRELSSNDNAVADPIVLGADTTVTLDGQILAKPENEADAIRMLKMLSGRTHRVITGVAVVRGPSTADRASAPEALPPGGHESAHPTAARGRSARFGHGLRSTRSAVPPAQEELPAGPICEVAAEVTAVSFVTLSDAEIRWYVSTGEPMDKAGAYAIQGKAARWIPRIEGCYFNVVGLPVALVSSMLEGIVSGK